MHLHRILEQPGDLFAEIFLGVIEIEVVVNLPVTLHHDLAVLDEQIVPRLQLGDLVEKRLALEAELETQVFLERLGIRANALQERQQRLHLRREVEAILLLRVVERLDAEAIAGAEQGLRFLVPEREGEHAAEVLHAIGAPFAVGAQDDFGVGLGAELLAADDVAQLKIVVDFAVEGEPIAGFIGHRLVAGREIDDAQTAMGEPDMFARMDPEALAVWPTMLDDRVHRNQVRRYRERRCPWTLINPAMPHIRSLSSAQRRRPCPPMTEST